MSRVLYIHTDPCPATLSNTIKRTVSSSRILGIENSARAEETGADLKGLRADVAQLRTDMAEVKGELVEFRKEAIESLERIDERLDHLSVKWMEHDAEIKEIKKRQA